MFLILLVLLAFIIVIGVVKTKIRPTSTIVVLLLFCACNSNTTVTDIASFEFDNAWYWVCTYTPEATENDRQTFVKRWAHPQQTAFFFFYPDNVSVGYYARERFSLNDLRHNLLTNPKASYGYMKIPGQPIETDALFYIDF